ncbi:Odorant receptor [Operophtera brumata]|uniref:NAD(+) ADP-ribosyltransferase n=1 Tax=Operophtera brumata TaxID=104452 RepID=A0A0L7KJA8_OPEBR|nr:Odorant receptor [Operophtera brumata]
MGCLIRNANTSASLSLTALKLVGFWAPDGLRGDGRRLYSCYTAFSFMFLLGLYLQKLFYGTYLIIQVIDLFLIWGDLPLMTGTAFLLFTNLAQAAKIFNILSRRPLIQSIIDDANRVLTGVETAEAKEIVKRCNRETTLQQCLYFTLTVITTIGWATSAENNQLPLRAWYPYDTSKSPAYELTYIHQVTALFIAAYLNVGKDTLQMLTPEQEQLTRTRLRECVREHQIALEAVEQLQACFSAPTFAQFTVSLIIICDEAHVYKDYDDTKYTVTLCQTDVVAQKNSYYKLQVLERDDKKKYYLFRSWGRIGTKIGGHKLEDCRSAEDAVQQFENLYMEKTENPWECRDMFEKLYPSKDFVS